MRQTRTPLLLVQNAGLIPAAAVIAALCLSGGAMGQNAAKPDAKAQTEKPKVAVSEHMTVDIHVKDESIGNVMELLSIQSQRNIILSRNVQGKVSADLYNVTFDEALDAILNVNGFIYEKKGNFIYVRTLEEQREIEKSRSRRVVKIIRLSYLNATDAAEFVKPMLSQGGEIKTTAKTENFVIPENTPTGKNDYALGDALAVFDQEENIAQIEKLLQELDTRPAQVLVEATILETKLNEENAFGVDFSIIGDLKFTDFTSIGGPRRAADSIIRGGTGATGGFSPPDNGGQAIGSTAGNAQDGKATFKVGVVSDFAAVFARLLDDVSDTTVLSNPKLLALNRQPSRVLVGQRVGYLNTTATETSTTQTVEFLDTGTQLYFRPFVSRDGTEIRMELKPQVSSATIRDAGNGQGGIVSIPDETTQEVVTNVIVKDGSTIVLGGLFVEDTFAQRRQVPVLGDIPIIGAAFRGHDDRTTRRELIFLIRPSIVNDTAMAMTGVDVQKDIERLRAGQRQGTLPWSREKMTSSLNVEAEEAARAGDSQRALWLLNRSLSLNPRQQDALAVRERITSLREEWPDKAIMDSAIHGEMLKHLERIMPMENAPNLTPEGSIDFPKMPVDAPMKGANAGEPNGQPESISAAAVNFEPEPAAVVAAPGAAVASGEATNSSVNHETNNPASNSASSSTSSGAAVIGSGAGSEIPAVTDPALAGEFDPNIFANIFAQVPGALGFLSAPAQPTGTEQAAGNAFTPAQPLALSPTAELNLGGARPDQQASAKSAWSIFNIFFNPKVESMARAQNQKLNVQPATPVAPTVTTVDENATGEQNK